MFLFTRIAKQFLKHRHPTEEYNVFIHKNCKAILEAQASNGSLRFYQRPIRCCINRLTPVMPVQQQKPITMGFPPVLTSLTISVFKPMALMASTMKNLLSSLTGVNTPASMPAETATVVMTEAAIK